jgi:hypothetical protein
MNTVRRLLRVCPELNTRLDSPQPRHRWSDIVTTTTDVRHFRTTARPPRQTTNPKDPQAVRATAPAPTLRVVLLATCLAGLFLAAWAPDAFAQTASKSKTTNKDFTTSPTSPCTGERVDVQGTQTVQTQVQPQGANTRFTFKDHQHGKGVGATSQASYQYEDIAQDTSVVSSTCAFYIRKTSNEHLVRKGNRPPVPDDFFARSRFLLNQTNDCQTVLTIEAFDVAACK